MKNNFHFRRVLLLLIPVILIAVYIYANVTVLGCSTRADLHIDGEKEPCSIHIRIRDDSTESDVRKFMLESGSNLFWANWITPGWLDDQKSRIVKFSDGSDYFKEFDSMFADIEKLGGEGRFFDKRPRGSEITFVFNSPEKVEVDEISAVATKYGFKVTRNEIRISPFDVLVFPGTEDIFLKIIQKQKIVTEAFREKYFEPVGTGMP